MFEKHKRLVGSLPLLIAVVAGFAGCTHTLAARSKPQPISEQGHIHGPFYVIGFLNSGHPKLLRHEIGMEIMRRHYKTQAEFREACGEDALWAKDCRDNTTYSFYIDRKTKAQVEQELTAATGNSMQSVTTTILEDHPSTKSQRVRVDFGVDDGNITSVYSVDHNSVRPLEYGDLTKSDGFLSLIVGLKYMLAFYVLGRIAVAIGQSIAGRPDMRGTQ